MAKRNLPWQKPSLFDNDPFHTLMRDMGGLFESFNDRASENGSLMKGVFTPRANIGENSTEFLVSVELPGVSEKDISVELNDRYLTIRGEKKNESESKDGDYHRIESAYGAFSRTFSLPRGIEGDKIAARFENGMLKVTLPKSKEAQSSHRKIEVKAS